MHDLTASAVVASRAYICGTSTAFGPTLIHLMPARKSILSIQHSSLIVVSRTSITASSKGRSKGSLCKAAPQLQHAVIGLPRNHEVPLSPSSNFSKAVGIDSYGCTVVCGADNTRNTQPHTHLQSSSNHGSAGPYATSTSRNLSCSKPSRPSAQSRSQAGRRLVLL